MDSMGIDLASLPCRDMVPKNHENLFGYHRSAPNQVRYIKDMNVYIVTAVISLFAYLWSRPKPAQVDSVPLRHRHPWQKLFQNFQLICIAGILSRYQECILSKIAFLVANRWYHMPTSHLTSTKQKRHQRLCFWYRKYLHVLFVFCHYYWSKTIYYRRSHFSITYYRRCSFCSVTEALPCGVGYLWGSTLFVRCWVWADRSLTVEITTGSPIFHSEVWSCFLCNKNGVRNCFDSYGMISMEW